jgi:hypothetical protein
MLYYLWYWILKGIAKGSVLRIAERSMVEKHTLLLWYWISRAFDVFSG